MCVCVCVCVGGLRCLSLAPKDEKAFAKVVFRGGCFHTIRGRTLKGPLSLAGRSVCVCVCVYVFVNGGGMRQYNEGDRERKRERKKCFLFKSCILVLIAKGSSFYCLFFFLVSTRHSAVTNPPIWHFISHRRWRPAAGRWTQFPSWKWIYSQPSKWDWCMYGPVVANQTQEGGIHEHGILTSF